MVGRSLRFAFLALAAWAVLFAPGVAANEGGGQTTQLDPDRVPAAVIAPTFGPDGAVLTRAGSKSEQLARDCSVPMGNAPSAGSTLQRSEVASADSGHPASTGNADCMRQTSTRAPPGE